MKYKFNFILSFILFFISSFLFLNTFFAETYFDYDLENYSYLNKVKASNLNTHFNRFSNDNLIAIKNFFDDKYGSIEGNPYILFYYSEFNDLNNFNLVLLRFNDSFNTGALGYGNGFIQISLGSYGMKYIDVLEYYDFDFDNSIVSLSDDHNVSGGIYMFDSNVRFFSFPMWTSRDLHWNDLIPLSKDEALKTLYYIDDYSSFDEKYKSYYNYIPYDYYSYIYTILDLVGINTTKPSNIYTYVDYEIRYYFDNVLDNNKTFKDSGKVGDVIDKFTDYSNDDYYLIENDYSIRLAKDVDNILNVYFKSYKTYKIEYYFDDVLRDDYSEFKKGKVGDVITEFTDYSDNDFKLYGENYSFTICEDDYQNIFRIYYRSNKYGSGASYEQIDTRNSKIPLIFHYDTIKDLFTGINFNSFTQSEQLMITIFINIWFVGIFSFVTWLFLKIVYKIFQLFY